jgi:hypothetical protein
MQFIQGKNSVGQGRNAGLQFHVTSIPPEKISDVNVKHQASLIDCTDIEHFCFACNWTFGFGGDVRSTRECVCGDTFARCQ